MQFHFKCSDKKRDISSLKVIDTLHSDEIAELICEDYNNIYLFSEKKLKRLNYFDVLTIISVHPELLGFFTTKLKRNLKPKEDIERVIDRNFFERCQWDWVVEAQPKLKLYTSVFFGEE